MAKEAVSCDVVGCGESAKRSLPRDKVRKAVPSLTFSKESRRVHLCRDHYRKFRKATKEERTLERLSW